jgi:hypothetical protein
MAKKKRSKKKRSKKKPEFSLRQKVYFALSRAFDGDDLYNGLEEAGREAQYDYQRVIEKEIFGGESLSMGQGENVTRMVNDMWEQYVVVESDAFTRGLQALAEEIQKDPTLVDSEDAMHDIADGAAKAWKDRNRSPNPVPPSADVRGLKSKLLR